MCKTRVSALVRPNCTHLGKESPIARLTLAVEFEEDGWAWETKKTGKRGWISSEQLERFVRGPAADKNE
jgi:hypothetical protein